MKVTVFSPDRVDIAGDQGGINDLWIVFGGWQTEGRG